MMNHFMNALTDDVVVMNFTHVYEDHAFVQVADAHWIDCTQLEGTARYCDNEAYTELQRLMSPFSPNGLHWIDSGDYHYLSKLWVDKLSEPFALVVYDHHPDMQQPAFGDILSCGGWLRQVIEGNSLLRQVVLIGIADELECETYGFDGLLTVIPEKRVLQGEVFADIPEDMPVYLSIDKDVLSRAYVLTNWDQGCMTSEQLCQSLCTYMQRNHILGIDVCGEEPRVLTDAALSADRLQNKRFNEALYEFLKSNV